MPKDYRRVNVERLEAIKARLRKTVVRRHVELSQQKREMLDNSIPPKRRTKLRSPISKFGRADYLRRNVSSAPSGGWAETVGQIYCGPDRSEEDEFYRASFLMRGTREATEAEERRLIHSARNANTTTGTFRHLEAT